MLKNTSKKDLFIAICIGVYIGLVIWITLLCRTPEYKFRVILPFWSYLKILTGDLKFLHENIENILMFIPMGYLLQMILNEDWKKVAKLALFLSLGIEIVQLVTTLGCFEFDDLLHNTIGAILGAVIFKAISFHSCFNIKIQLKPILAATIIVIVLFWGLGQLKSFIVYQRMVPFASLNDRDGMHNLFVPSGKNGYCGDTDVFIRYLEDGSISITGKSDKKSWFELGQIILQPGDYMFEGLTNVREKTVALELEYYDQTKHSFARLAPDIGPVEKVEFRLDEKTKIRGLVRIYPECDCNVIARPAIFKLGE